MALPPKVERLLALDRPMTADELRFCVNQLEPPSGRGQWNAHRRALRYELLNNEPREILRWATIQATMFVGDGAPWTPDQKAFLESFYDTETLFKLLIDHGSSGSIRQSDVAWQYTSGSYIEQLMHLTHWQMVTGRPVAEMDRIMEVGGGYGAMRLMAHRLGFRGEYTILDLPEVLLVQAYYLSQLRERLPTILTDEPSKVVRKRYDLVIGSVSLSEMTISGRLAAIGSRAKSKGYLIRAQNKWAGIDNVEWFSKWADDNDDLTWHWLGVPGTDSEFYLIGDRHGERKEDIEE